MRLQHDNPLPPARRSGAVPAPAGGAERHPPTRFPADSLYLHIAIAAGLLWLVLRTV